MPRRYAAPSHVETAQVSPAYSRLNVRTLSYNSRDDNVPQTCKPSRSGMLEIPFTGHLRDVSSTNRVVECTGLQSPRLRPDAKRRVACSSASMQQPQIPNSGIVATSRGQMVNSSGSRTGIVLQKFPRIQNFGQLWNSHVSVADFLGPHRLDDCDHPTMGFKTWVM